MTTNDGGSALVFRCSRCRKTFEGKEYNRKDHRCPPCKRAAQNASNAANPERLSERSKRRYIKNPEYWRKYAETRRNDPAYAQRRWARRRVATEVNAGRLVRLPCSQCGSARSQAHHEDYAKPLAVTWLCGRCHARADAMLVERAKAVR